MALQNEIDLGIDSKKVDLGTFPYSPTTIYIPRTYGISGRFSPGRYSNFTASVPMPPEFPLNDFAQAIDRNTVSASDIDALIKKADAFLTDYNRQIGVHQGNNDTDDANIASGWAGVASDVKDALTEKLATLQSKAPLSSTQPVSQNQTPKAGGNKGGNTDTGSGGTTQTTSIFGSPWFWVGLAGLVGVGGIIFYKKVFKK